MKTSTSDGKHVIQWIDWMQLDNLDFADDLALLSHTREQMHMKTTSGHQHTQRKKQDPRTQHGQHQPNHVHGEVLK
ncbi:unnamed protein product [Schistosoma mattheei]|uniref:Uncharacterized protein n=1 Tax=Schistosoma mattheei TaxID=31246 RepID=A0A183NMW7_9TREM|nr:unnamed protein product [Schistosoma mattheei]